MKPLEVIKSRLEVSPLAIGSAATRPAHRPSVVCAAAAATSISDAHAVPVVDANGQSASFPSVAGVYAVYDADGTLQYVGISRRVNISVATHLEALPDLVGTVKVAEMPDAGKEELTEAWRQWIQEAGGSLATLSAFSARLLLARMHLSHCCPLLFTLSIYFHT